LTYIECHASPPNNRVSRPLVHLARNNIIPLFWNSLHGFFVSSFSLRGKAYPLQEKPDIVQYIIHN
jgi:hypothetical protein